MNITPINLISFKGEWRTKDVTKRRAPFEEHEDRTWTYHPDADETPESVQKAIAEKKAQFEGRRKMTKETLGGGDYFTVHHYKNIVKDKPGKRFLSPEKTAELQQEQKTLVKRLREITKTLKRKPSESEPTTKTKTVKPAKPKAPRVKDVVYRTAHGLVSTFQPRPMRMVKKGNITQII